MWSRAELERFLEKQQAAESALLADPETAAEFWSARSSWDATVGAAYGDDDEAGWRDDHVLAGHELLSQTGR